MYRFISICLITLALLITQARAGTHVWAMYGWGDNALGSSRGIDQIAARAAKIPGVTTVRVFNYWQTQAIADGIMATPAGDTNVLVGYSCGANSASTIAFGLNGHRNVVIATIQPSVWCGGYPLGGNIPYVQETYGGCLLTLGFGCKIYDVGPGFTGNFVKIKRPDLHPQADTDPDAQNDVLSVIAAAANPQLRRAFVRKLAHGRTTEIVRFHGQRP